LDTTCPGCGAALRLNPNLAGATVPCPSCGAGVAVPAPERAPRTRAAPRRRTPAPAPPRPPRPPYTLWLLGAQAALAVLGLSCLGGALLDLAPPAWSYLAEPGVVLFGAGVGLLAAGWFATYAPVLATLVVALLVMGACALGFARFGEVDASRTLGLMTAMLAVWLALQHRRATHRPTRSAS